jgi:hypothetical protein
MQGNQAKEKDDRVAFAVMELRSFPGIKLIRILKVKQATREGKTLGKHCSYSIPDEVSGYDRRELCFDCCGQWTLKTLTPQQTKRWIAEQLQRDRECGLYR